MSTKILCIFICLLFLFNLVSCNKQENSNMQENSNNIDSGVQTNLYSMEYDTFIENIKQIVGQDEMFISFEKTSTHGSYDNNVTDLYEFESTLSERKYSMAIINDGNFIKSIDVYGERDKISEGVYSSVTDFVLLTSVVYQILNQQTYAYGTMISEFNMSSQDASIMEVESSEHWAMIYSANNEKISFLCQLKTEQN